MSPRRDRPVSSREAAVGAVVIVLVVAGIVRGSYALLVPAEVEEALAAPAEEEVSDAGRGPRPCPVEALGEADEAATVTSEDLIECPDLFDSRRVLYEGEAVGVVMRRGDVAWLHVNDDAYSATLGPLPRHRLTVGGNAGMAVVVPVSAADGIVTGSFNRHGTGLEISGTYYKNHPADAGSPAIHADRVEVVREVQPVDHPVSQPRLVTAYVLGALTLALAIVWRRRR